MTCSIPYMIVVVILLTYMFLGAAMYTIWEKEWSYMDAFYFVFISIR